ncbi:hypothetical protein RHSIM_Rhsim05G0003100 [Rhododendron simsii]|uniref:MOSC domain-containing protein n=1 Tax=Rhododendron simsii TaxID=118357 RepID=A0A834GZV8_RHOSS|nr:hypothetical protein RHSIM_Rhsim05G0003100 [Rhododendron simsii]
MILSVFSLFGYTGFRWDRQWLVVNSKGRAYTPRVEPKLALVQVELPNEAFSEGWEPTKSSHLVIRAPGMDELKVPLSKPCEIANGVSVWEWFGSVFDEGNEASKWFSNYLGKPSRLVRFNEATETRVVDPNYVCGHKTMFSDRYPFLLLSQVRNAGVRTSRLYRDNILEEGVREGKENKNKISSPVLLLCVTLSTECHSILVYGCEPFSEDLWKEIKINRFTFHGVKLCSRCKMILFGEYVNLVGSTINQETAIPSSKSEPTVTLSTFRSDKVLRPTRKQGKVYFGQNMVCMDSVTDGKGKMIKVGDPVYVHKVHPSCADAPASTRNSTQQDIYKDIIIVTLPWLMLCRKIITECSNNFVLGPEITKPLELPVG